MILQTVAARLRWLLHLLLRVTSSVTTGYFICYYPLLLLLRTKGFITTCYYVVMGSLLRSKNLLLRSNGSITTCYYRSNWFITTNYSGRNQVVMGSNGFITTYY